jgi:hypothetical protein
MDTGSCFLREFGAMCVQPETKKEQNTSVENAM